MKNHSVVLCFYNIFFMGVPKERQRSILRGFWGPFESPLGISFEYVGGAVALLGHRLGEMLR